MHGISIWQPGEVLKTPTINELSYRADGQSGMNFGLKPSTNDTIEIGSKTRIGDGLLSLALFQTDTDDEIVVDSSSGGRTTYKNAGKTRRQGAELAWDQRFAGDFRVKRLDGLMRPIAAMCAMNRIVTVTGCRIARNMGFASIGYIPEDGWYAGTEARYMGDIMADDENTAKAPSYTLVGLFTGYKYITTILPWIYLVVSIIYSIKNTLALSLSMSQTGDITNLRPDEIMVSA